MVQLVDAVDRFWLVLQCSVDLRVEHVNEGSGLEPAAIFAL